MTLFMYWLFGIKKKSVIEQAKYQSQYYAWLLISRKLPAQPSPAQSSLAGVESDQTYIKYGYLMLRFCTFMS